MADRYYPIDLQDGNRRYGPSVTTVCRVLAKEGLYNYFVEQGIISASQDIFDYAVAEALLGMGAATRDEIVKDCKEYIAQNMARWIRDANEASNESKAIGTHVHAIIDLFHQGGDGWVKAVEEAPPLVARLVKSYTEWFNISVEKVHLTEAIVWGFNGNTTFVPVRYYAGKLDLFCTLTKDAIIRQTAKRRYAIQPDTDCRLAMVDVKTSNDFYDEYAMQLAGYAGSSSLTRYVQNKQLLVDNGWPPHLLSVRLDKKDGQTYVREWEWNRSRRLWTNALNMWYDLHPTAIERYIKAMEKPNGELPPEESEDE